MPPTRIAGSGENHKLWGLMGTPRLGYQFKIGDTVAYRRDTWRKGTVIEINPLSSEVRILWKKYTTTVSDRKLVLINRTNKSANQQLK